VSPLSTKYGRLDISQSLASASCYRDTMNMRFS
jgi:hypothetical protein